MKKLASILMLVLMLAMSTIGMAATAKTNPSATETPANYISYEDPYVGKTAESDVTLRASAYSRGKIVDTLRKGIKLNVYGAMYASDGSLWYQVETTSHKEGWVPAELVTFDDTATKTATSAIGKYVGNINSGVYHLPTCRVLPKPENQVPFNSKRQAESNGYRACSICKP
ncbi:MAG: SH3 domain-containing protein [Selenomonadaceae bacterium]|nr:SH3 domain-containing protein [Selenomonadaceae bacterium]